MVRKIWLVRFQLWFLCFTSVNFHQERGFAEGGVITVSNSRWKIGKVVDVDGSREIGFLGRKTMVHALSREDEGSMEKTRRRIPGKNAEENKDSEKFNRRFADYFNNEVERTGLKSKSLLKMAEKQIVYTRKTRREEDGKTEERLMKEAEKIAELMRDDYGGSSHPSPPVNNHHPYHLQETSKP